MYMDFKRNLRNYKFTIVMKGKKKRIEGIINAPNDLAAKEYISEYSGFNDDNALIAITC